MISRSFARLALVALALPFAIWLDASPSRRLLDMHSSVFFPPSTGEGAVFQYFHTLRIHDRGWTRFATCVLCSVEVGVPVDRVTVLWGNVIIASGGSAECIEVRGGSIIVQRDAAPVHFKPNCVSAAGGSVSAVPGLDPRAHGIYSRPALFFPGQRSFPLLGTVAFVAFLLVTVFVSSFAAPRAMQKARTATSYPLKIVIYALAFVAAIVLGWVVAVFAFYLFFPIGWIFMLAVPAVVWIVIAVGSAAVAEWIGSWLVKRNARLATLAGASTITAILLVPIVGAFALIALLLACAGFGSYSLLLRRMPRFGSH